MQFPQVPEAWLQAMARVSAVAGTPCVLGGGAIRDLVLGQSIKDLDITVPFSEARFQALLQGFSEFPKTQHVNVGTSEYIEGMQECKAVLGFDVPGIPPLNIIMLAERVGTDVLSVVERNDFGICQIGCNSNGHIEATEAFYKDVENKTFTNTRFGDEPRARRRFERLSQKYPDYTPVNLDPPQDEFVDWS